MLSTPPKKVVNINKMTATILIIAILTPAFCDDIKTHRTRIAMGQIGSAVSYSNLLTSETFQELQQFSSHDPLGLTIQTQDDDADYTESPSPLSLIHI